MEKDVSNRGGESGRAPRARLTRRFTTLFRARSTRRSAPTPPPARARARARAPRRKQQRASRGRGIDRGVRGARRPDTRRKAFCARSFSHKALRARCLPAPARSLLGGKQLLEARHVTRAAQRDGHALVQRHVGPARRTRHVALRMMCALPRAPKLPPTHAPLLLAMPCRERERQNSPNGSRRGASEKSLENATKFAPLPEKNRRVAPRRGHRRRRRRHCRRRPLPPPHIAPAAHCRRRPLPPPPAPCAVSTFTLRQTTWAAERRSSPSPRRPRGGQGRRQRRQGLRCCRSPPSPRPRA